MAKGSFLLRDAVARCASWEGFVRQLRNKSDKEKGACGDWGGPPSRKVLCALCGRGVSTDLEK